MPALAGSGKEKEENDLIIYFFCLKIMFLNQWLYIESLRVEVKDYAKDVSGDVCFDVGRVWVVERLHERYESESPGEQRDIFFKPGVCQ